MFNFGGTDANNNDSSAAAFNFGQDEDSNPGCSSSGGMFSFGDTATSPATGSASGGGMFDFGGGPPADSPDNGGGGAFNFF